MRLTLLRAPKLPNPESDIYTHTFTYRLLAHQGDWRQGGTVRNAWELNCPVLTYRTNNHNGELPAVGSLLKVDRPNVMLEACKKAEDDDDVIVRFVEHHGRQDQVLFSFADEVATVRSVREVNLVEDQQGKASKPLKSGVKFQTRPYEINSLKLKAAKKVSAKKK
jgi:alpha-mannosidase